MNFIPKQIGIRWLYTIRKLYWDLLSSSWDEFLIDSGYAEEIEQIVEIVNSNKNSENPSLLDLGCATGSYSTAFSKKHFIVTGLDYAEKMIRKARQKAEALQVKDIKFEIADFNNGLRFNQSQFDIVIAAHIFKAVKDTQFLLQEITRILKEGGLFVLVIKKERERNPSIQEGRKSFNNFLLKLLRIIIFNDGKKGSISNKVIQTLIETSSFVVHRKFETAKNIVILFKKRSSDN